VHGKLIVLIVLKLEQCHQYLQPLLAQQSKNTAVLRFLN
jgi:hypothetical protein